VDEKHLMKTSEEIVYEDIKKVCKTTELEPFKNAKVLLAGANGLLGSYFAYLFNYLNEKKNFDITCDCITKSEISRESKIFPLKNSPGIHFIAKDLAQPTIYKEPYDFVIYAAGYSAPAKFLQDPLAVINVNFIGMRNVLESVVRVNPKCAFLYFSSSEIYGNPTPENIPTPETYNGNVSITNNRACYIESKRLTEVLCLVYKKKFGTDIKIVRPALTYGPGITFEDKRVIGQFMGKAYKNKVIEMIDDGRDLRSFCYIRDMFRQLLSVLLSGKETIYNVGSSEEEMSIKDLAYIIGKRMGAEVKLGPGKTEAVSGAPSRVCLDLSRVIDEFGFRPEVKMEEGLQRTIDWNKALLKSNE
jgi:UDP-glucuronate decarboxylase